MRQFKVCLFVGFFFLFLPCIVQAKVPPNWVWVFSSNTTNYYLDTAHDYAHDDGSFFYAIKEVYADDNRRIAVANSFARKDSRHDFSNFGYGIATYLSYASADSPTIVRRFLHFYCYNADGTFIVNFHEKRPIVYHPIRHGSVDEIIDLKARSWAVYRPSN